ncbi:hypothetical protein D3C81_1397900 [compost metagenome]
MLLQVFLTTVFGVLDGDFHRLGATVGKGRNVAFAVVQLTVERFTEFTPQLTSRTAHRHLRVERHIGAQQVDELIDKLRIVVAIQRGAVTAEEVSNRHLFALAVAVKQFTAQRSVELAFQAQGLHQFNEFRPYVIAVIHDSSIP